MPLRVHARQQSPPRPQALSFGHTLRGLSFAAALQAAIQYYYYQKQDPSLESDELRLAEAIKVTLENAESPDSSSQTDSLGLENFVPQHLPAAFDHSTLSQIIWLYKPAEYQKLNEWQKQIKLESTIEFVSNWHRETSYRRNGADLTTPYPKTLVREAFQTIQKRLEAVDRIKKKYGATEHKTLPSALDPTYNGPVNNQTRDHLLLHFKEHTSTAFNVDPIDRRVSDRILSGIAFSLSFESSTLRNCMLALSALHLKHMEIVEPGEINRIANWLVFQCQAQFNADLEIADSRSIPHLMVTSLLMTAVASDKFRQENEEDGLQIIGWMRLWMGISVMMQRLTVPGLLNYGLSKLFYRPPFNTDGALEHAPEKLHFAAKFFMPGDDDSRFAGVFHEVLKCIGVLYKHLKDGLSPMMRLRIITWFTFLPTEFTELVAARNVRALAFIAHYAMFLKMTTRVWWMENVGQRTLKQVVQYIRHNYDRDQYGHMVDIPELAIYTDDLDDLGRMMLKDTKWVHEPMPFTPEEMMYWDAREPFVNDTGRVTVPDNPDLVTDESAPGGLAMAVWRARP
ncbi:hypothetical protein NLG97_g2672 [Lecanicillium saksenae]|uniref:Uncharacterized protein n=1 Tax=Lecanicillium saksenae TaxID=468837 RepID=A0ACC1R3M7_9HYPO|nr:hypothetical protein NLG97_g2672 [Lecanicillium saksenae]